MAPKIQLLITTFNRLDLFKLCLDSVLNQSYQNIEIIILDNSDEDGIKDYIEKLGNDKIYFKKNSINIGALANTRKTFSFPTAKYFYHLTSDVMIEKTAVEKMVHFLEENKNVPSVFTGCMDYSLDGRKIETENFFIKKKLINSKTGVYPTLPILKQFFYKKLNATYSIWESMHNTDFFINHNFKNLEWGIKGEEYKKAIEFMLHTEHIGYIAEPLKFNIVHDNIYSMRGFRYNYFEIIDIYTDLIYSYKKILLARGISLAKTRMNIAIKHVKNLFFLDKYSIESAIILTKFFLNFLGSFIIIITTFPLSVIFSIFRMIKSTLIKIIKKRSPEHTHN